MKPVKIRSGLSALATAARIFATPSGSEPSAVGVLHVDRAVGAHAERRAQRLRDALGPDRHDHDLGLRRVLDPQRLFERVGVVAVDLELDVVFLDPAAVGAHVEARVLVREPA